MKKIFRGIVCGILLISAPSVFAMPAPGPGCAFEGTITEVTFAEGFDNSNEDGVCAPGDFCKMPDRYQMRIFVDNYQTITEGSSYKTCDEYVDFKGLSWFQNVPVDLLDKNNILSDELKVGTKVFMENEDIIYGFPKSINIISEFSTAEELKPKPVNELVDTTVEVNIEDEEIVGEEVSSESIIDDESIDDEEDNESFNYSRYLIFGGLLILLFVILYLSRRTRRN